ncbi:outer membrane protein assembly factor BamC [Candidatus Erwinia haradaeae]|uniref:Outer membrane protein assembly factor BamC n=1 Tax=Candidatus Erwinia haradaeae TaxID=1922217 RepID=A0A451D938_9GAMM|nr:outer membrane protein assembly factor BamC [Candidatus Erwinia haradaeae]VFP82807.1 Outer membrane protein assembly factor BamC [Candidatus Erwinia haradaeae]
MAKTGYQYIIILPLVLICTMFFSACSTDPYKIHKEVLSKSESSSGHLKELKSPPGIVLPITNDFWYVPFVHLIRKQDAPIDLQPPRQTLTSGHDNHMHVFGNVGTLVINNAVGSSWLQVVDSIKKAHISIVDRRDDRQILYTDWIQWHDAADTQYFGRYKISVHRHGNQNIIVVTLVHLRKKDNSVYSSSNIQKYTAQMLHYISSRLELYQAYHPVLESLSRNGFQDRVYVTSGTDYAGLPNLILHAPFDHAWRWLPHTLQSLGMTIKEDHYTQGLMQIKYKSLHKQGFHKGVDVDMHLKNGDYKIQIGDLGTHSSMQFFTIDGYPLSRYQHEALVNVLQQLALQK